MTQPQECATVRRVQTDDQPLRPPSGPTCGMQKLGDTAGSLTLPSPLLGAMMASACSRASSLLRKDLHATPRPRGCAAAPRGCGRPHVGVHVGVLERRVVAGIISSMGVPLLRGRDDECAGCCHHLSQRVTIMCRHRVIHRKICPRDQSMRQLRDQSGLSQPLQN